MQLRNQREPNVLDILHTHCLNEVISIVCCRVSDLKKIVHRNAGAQNYATGAHFNSTVCTL